VGGGVSSLKGIENIPNIDWLGVVDNQVESLEPLRTLTKLTFLKLDNNRIREVEPVSRLPVLATLYVYHNYVDDIMCLYDMTWLKTAGLGDNCIPKEQFYVLKEKNPDIVIGVDLDNYVIPEKCK